MKNSSSGSDEHNALIRAFIAVLIPEPAKSTLASYLKTLTPLARLRWVTPAQFHITIRFLGEQPQSTIEQVKAVLRPVSFDPFEVELSHAGAFPSLENPRSLWLSGKNGTKELNNLVKVVNSSLDSTGFPREKRAFKAHLTLARTNGMPLPAELLQALRNPPRLTFTCKSFALMRSRLTPHGAVYSEIPLSS